MTYKTIDQIRQDARSTSEFAEPLAAGRYWVGDPCYAFSNDLPGDLWGQWLGEAWKNVDANRIKILDGRVAGMRIVASGTQYGDGQYGSNIGASFPVDAGLIGVVHEKFLANLYPELEGEPFGMTLVDFPVPFHVSYDDDEGTITIGHVVVDTGDSNWDEDEDED